MSASAGRYAAVIALALATAAGARAQVLFTDFESDPSATGWFIPSSVPGITTAQAHSGTHSFSLNQSANLFSPLLQPTYAPGQYVEVDYYAYNPTGSLTAGGMDRSFINPAIGWSANTAVYRVNDFSDVERVSFNSLDANANRPGPYAYIDDVTIRPITPAAAVQVQRANFATFMPQPFAYTAPANRQARLPNTMATLAAGGTANVVMMGDSIVADTYFSYFEAQAQQHTGGTLKVSAAIVGGSSATFWSQNIGTNITPTTNLLMFGGISTQAPDIPALDSVIQQARAINPNIEIVLMGPVAGPYNPFADPSLALPADPNGTDYRSQLLQLANADGVQFWDLTAPFDQYILNSGLTYNDFLRDGLHMNARGQYLVGDVLESFFTPVPVPEPSSLALAGLAGGAVAAAWRRRARAAVSH
ncbi:MAG TPA: SGNH/GDSL hydrolase family protein [Gemmataceae bacterium]|jgi:lysophospholipase L1-like esterase